MGVQLWSVLRTREAVESTLIWKYFGTARASVSMAGNVINYSLRWELCESVSVHSKLKRWVKEKQQQQNKSLRQMPLSPFAKPSCIVSSGSTLSLVVSIRMAINEGWGNSGSCYNIAPLKNCLYISFTAIRGICQNSTRHREKTLYTLLVYRYFYIMKRFRILL